MSTGGRSRVSSGAIVTLAMLSLVGTCEQQVEHPRPDCPIQPGWAAWEDIEVSCDGADNDCDGFTDELLPVAANRCETDKKGACHFGFARCSGKARRCEGPYPSDEAHDGIDNDCDGTVDEVVAGVHKPLRARVLVPPGVPEEDPSLVKALQLALSQHGIPHDINTATSGFEQGFERLDEYSLAIVPGYVAGTLTQQHVDQLGKWVARGNVLVMFKPLKIAGQQHLLQFAGLASEKKRDNVDMIAIDPSPIALWLDSPEERFIPWSRAPELSPVRLYLPALEGGAQVIARGLEKGKNRGAAMLRKAHGHGAIYTIGFEPLGFHHSRCYVNCFDPGRDIFGLLMKGALRESGKGHYAVAHTVPGPEPGVFVASHDVDAPDAFWLGPWGKPGALQMAEMEKAEGVAASYFVTSDFVTDYWRPGLVRELCHRGNCPEGGHSVQHLDWTEFPVGSCDVKRADYDPTKPTVCAEIVLNLKELIAAAGKMKLPLDGWRTPYLENNPRQFEYLAAAGVKWDSSVAIGDVRTQLPFEGKRFPYHQHDLFRGQAIVHFPVVLEDGIGWYEGTEEKRQELHKGVWPNFRSRWTNTIIRNAHNGTWTVLLVHPSYGVGEGIIPQNVQVKVEATRYAIRLAKQLGLRVDKISALGPFWKGRQDAQLEAWYTEGEGYVGKVHVGDAPAPRYTIQFGDRVGTFDCPEAGPTLVKGRTVTFLRPLLPGRIYHFRAQVW